MITTDALKYLAHRFLAFAVLLDVKDIKRSKSSTNRPLAVRYRADCNR
jgi:hypothetical protein